jgi:hypothetical protein
VLCLAGVFNSQAGEQAEKPVTCRLAYSARVYYAPQILASRKGWFRADGVDVKDVNLGMSDVEFTAMVAAALEEQLERLSTSCDQIVVFMHHLPFVELVPQGRPGRFAFTAAFIGSERLGQVLRKFPKITHVFCGHSHWRTRIRIDQMDILAIGSTYREKHLEVLELP